MERKDLLDELEQELFNIHSQLFGGNITSEDLTEIKETLNEYSYILKRIKEYGEEVNKRMDILIKLYRLLFHTSSLLMLCFIILEILNLPIGIGLFVLFNYLSYKLKKEYQKSKENDKITPKVTKLIEDIKYKQDIASKKMKRLEKISELQIESSKRVEVQTMNNLQLEKPRTRILGLENRQV